MNKRRREDTAILEAAKSQVQLCDNGNGECGRCPHEEENLRDRREGEREQK